jgi:phenylacetate-CoA ligase
MRSQWWAPGRLEQWQARRLRETLTEVESTTPFYRELFRNHAFAPAEVRPPADLCALPALDKSALREVPLRDRLARGADLGRMVRLHTSGSTAEPFEVLLTPLEKDLRVLVDLRALSAHGIGPPDVVLAFRHMKNVVGGASRESVLGFYRRHYAPFGVPAVEKLKVLGKVNPDAMQAHPSTLVPMMEEIASGGWHVPDRLRLIISCTEYLDKPVRQRVERAFGVRVVDHYGMIEFGFLAWECPAGGGHHVNAEHFVVEIADPAGKPVESGETGEVVVTALEQRAMPLVRYRTGDRARWIDGECACGRRLPRLCLLSGRTVDRVFRADGSEVNPHCFSVMWEGVAGLIQFQVVQEALGALTYRYVAEPNGNPEQIEATLRVRIRAEFGEGTAVRFERVDSFASGESGKFKSIVSKVSPPVTKTAN